eukprot:ANDGO_06536.mRNA.1 Phosphodiesterase delta-like protein
MSKVDDPNVAFRIVGMSMHDGESGKVMWDSTLDAGFDAAKLVFVSNGSNTVPELEAHIPASVLQCLEVSRTIEFYSRDLMAAMRLEQHVYLGDQEIEEWTFDFGFVIPNSTNSWQTVVEAQGGENMIPAEVLSGNLVIDTKFMDADNVVAHARVRIFYV